MADSNRKGFYIFILIWTCLSLSAPVAWYAGVSGVSPAGAAYGVVWGLLTVIPMLRLLKH